MCATVPQSAVEQHLAKAGGQCERLALEAEEETTAVSAEVFFKALTEKEESKEFLSILFIFYFFSINIISFIYYLSLYTNTFI